MTIVSPRGASTPIRPDDLRAVLNLAGRGPGVYSVTVTVIAPHLEVKSVAPALRRRCRSKRSTGGSFRSPSATPAMQHGLVTSTVRVDPAPPTVRGATSDLARVASLRVDVPFPAGPERVDSMLRAVPVDARGDEVAGVVGRAQPRPRPRAHSIQRSELRSGVVRDRRRQGRRERGPYAGTRARNRARGRRRPCGGVADGQPDRGRPRHAALRNDARSRGHRGNHVGRSRRAVARSPADARRRGVDARARSRRRA